MPAGATSVHDALVSLRAQLAELDALSLQDEDTTALRAELVDAIRDAEEAAEEDDDDDIGVPHSAAFGNSGIHPRNRYANAAPDFAALARKQPVLRPFLLTDAAGRASLDFTDFGTTRALTAALLKEDFGVTWWLPEGHLCPTLTSRCNYLHWVEDLVALMPPPPQPPHRSGGGVVRGVDVGTGASAVYALLGAASQGWAFVATDVTDEALRWATRNVDANPHLKDLIQVRDARARDDASPASSSAARDEQQHPWPLLDGVLRPGETFTFTMCNPPFFEHASQAGRNPGTDCGGTDAEMVCPGGEAAFVARLVEESRRAHVAAAVTWFTTLCGKKATLRATLAALRAARAPAVRTACFRQGKTTRWGLAWSWAPAAEATQRVPLPVVTDANGAIAGSTAAAAPRPCVRASFTLRVAARDAGAPGAVLNALRAALQGCPEVADTPPIACDAAAFAVTGALRVVRGSAAADEQAPPKRARREAPSHVDGGATSAAAAAAADAAPFSAAVHLSSPCELTVTLQLLGGSRGSGPAQQALAHAARHVKAALTARWPEGGRKPAIGV